MKHSRDTMIFTTSSEGYIAEFSTHETTVALLIGSGVLLQFRVRRLTDCLIHVLIKKNERATNNRCIYNI